MRGCGADLLSLLACSLLLLLLPSQAPHVHPTRGSLSTSPAHE